MNEKGEHFGRRRKEKKGKETFYREEGRKENKKGRKKRKEKEKRREKKLAGGLTVMQQVVGDSLSAILGAQLIRVLLVE